MSRRPRTPEERAERRKHGLTFLRVLGLILAVSGAFWTGSWFLLAWGFPTSPEWLRGVGALWMTLLGASFSGMAYGRLVGARRPDPFAAFNEAFRRIARGDYSVQIDPALMGNGGPGGEFQALVGNLNAMTQALAQVEDLRRRFVADVSHEFQSPLTSILGFTQALADPGLDPAVRQRYLGIVEAEARRLSRLSENLLKLNSLEDRAGPPDPETFRVDTQWRDVIVALEPQWAAKDLVVEADLDEVQVNGNRELWTQVWTNLLTNAVKFTPRGGRIEVRLQAAGDGTGPVAEVADTGLGLAEADKNRVFERFYKADAARTLADNASGSGLGLALVHRIVSLHGARVEALSPGPGQGTTLRVTWPSVGEGEGQVPREGVAP